MVELRERPDGLLERSHGGDTLNTAVYLGRLGIGVDYATALATIPGATRWSRAGSRRGAAPPWFTACPGCTSSRQMQRANGASCIGATVPPPGFCGTIWTPRRSPSLVYLSGITLSIYDDAARDRLFATLATGKARLAADMAAKRWDAITQRARAIL